MRGKGDDSAFVYTNEDLVRFIRPEDRVPRIPGSVGDHSVAGAMLHGSSPDTTKDGDGTAKTEPAAHADPPVTLSEAQDRVNSAQQQIDLLKRQAVADANPFLPPPAPLSDAEKARRQGLPRDQILQQTREQMKKAETELQAAKSTLDSLGGGAPR